MNTEIKRLVEGIRYWSRELEKHDGSELRADVRMRVTGDLELRFIATWLQDGLYRQVVSQPILLQTASKRQLFRHIYLALLNLHREKSEQLLQLAADEALGDLTEDDLPF